jgi:hypothetical protein
MERADEFINQDETLRALLGKGVTQTSNSGEKSKKKKKEFHKSQDAAELGIKKKFHEYNWTPLNAPIEEVLAAIKMDPMYEKPSEIVGTPHPRTAHRYCAFHESKGHSTVTCRSLRVLIGKFIEKRKLVRFLASQWGQDQIIGFSNEDFVGVSLPHSDALVVTLAIANHNIHRVLVDTGISADIIYKSAFVLMSIDQGKLVPTRGPLVGFSGEQVLPMGAIELPVMAGTSPWQKTIMVKFLVMDGRSAYNVILGRPALNDLEAITSTPHLCMKFPTNSRVGVVRGDQKSACTCYNATLKDGFGGDAGKEEK